MKIEATPNQVRSLLRLAQTSAGPDAGQRGIPRPLLERYQALLDAGRHPPIVAIERGTCSGCHVRLPTMLAYKAVRALALHTCPHCGRMLYAAELASSPDAGAKASASGAPAATDRQS